MTAAISDFDLELVPRQPSAGLGASLPAMLVDRCPQRGVTHRVELDVRVAHPRVLVGPPSHLRHRALLVELVGVGARGARCVELAGQIAAIAFEPIDTHPLGIGQQPVGVAQKLGGHRRVEVADRAGDGVDMSRRHSAGCKRVLEVRHRRAHLLALLAGPRLLAGLPTLPGQQVLRRLGPALGIELALPASRAHVERVTPRLGSSQPV